MSDLQVVVDATAIRLGGGLSYVTRQLRGVARVAPDLDVRVISAPWNDLALREALALPVAPSGVRSTRGRLVHEQIGLPRHVPEGAVLHCPGNLAPILPGRRPATAVTIQNPNLFGVGRALPHNKAWYRRLRVYGARRSVEVSTRVIAVSESMMAQVRADVPDLGDRGVVVQSGRPEWVEGEERPGGLPVEGLDYLLSLANDAPHKRLDDLVLAWDRAFATQGADAPALVFVGGLPEARREQQRALVAPALRSRLLYTGAVDRLEVLRWLVAHGLAMVATSALEAHPHTPAEAGALGCPLVLSDIPPHRETATDHPYAYVPVGDIQALAGALAGVVVDGDRTPWTWPISWDDHARQLIGVWQAALADH